ncbi:hypothetical protein I3843_03G043700 [Carya illinoinensis]|uniref:Ribosomal protein mS38 C-terminal domain-containing protein n=1 Tax=Carya illinoinensis TaxID=32201 RepID=A0A8T1QYR3_CARIL|nr:hypothetical protein I3760_03G040500 [Carya illinoinensis]KAG6640773.1 hypothetical protein CIPAW_09G026700 [Carya illinoinensis]KAG6659607.1 hypothetical protein CIPAW_03G047400 [Carya illinoinensis]KAG6693972.1 hypothetical protein I3842_09G027100 [Carya illinoinensis]KAG6720104.1 hypothetical protein I3842_03G042300 [Carya illinoinensis]
MASGFLKLLRKSPAARFIAALQNPQAPNPTASLIFSQTCLIEPTDPTPFLGSHKAENLTHSEFSRIYPSFPFAFYLNPFCSTLSVPSEAEDAALGDCGTVWADSVKKKRKRKMNKHKYQKLRKRLGRQT